MQRHTILVYDTDPRSLELRALILRQAGYDVMATANAQAMANALQTGMPHAVILVEEERVDVAMVAAHVRSLTPVPIMALVASGWRNRADRKQLDAVVQKIDGPGTWLPQLRLLIDEYEKSKLRAQHHILNCDDNEVQRYAVSRMLLSAGYRVAETSTGQETLERASTDQHHLILLDVNLPDIHGFEVCRRLKKSPATARIPVMHLSATSTRPVFREQGLQNGADEYLTQPIGRDELVAAIDELIERYRAAM